MVFSQKFTKIDLHDVVLLSLRRWIVRKSMIVAVVNGLIPGFVEAQDVNELVAGNTQFTADLCKQLGGQPGNLFYSPSSISTALAMTHAGARGETAEQMAKTLHFTLPQDKLP